ncbi:MAG: putative metal-binding motif-containing protein [Myxococcota bacterium]
MFSTETRERRVPLRALGAMVALLAACGDDSAPMDDAAVDQRLEVFIDFGPVCVTDEECDDGIGCTVDRCENERCISRDDFALCDDGVFCNGREVCDRARGVCAAGAVESCNDGNVCTIDRCDEEGRVCRFAPRDFDNDGEADFNCPGGTDCDDRDPTRGATIAETCDDGIDNDCDEQIDEADCGAPRYDSCDDPLDVSAGGFFELNSLGSRPDHGIRCAPAGRADLVVRFELNEPADVTVRVQAESVAFVAVRTDCRDAAAELECQGGFPAEVRRRSLPAGEYFAILADVGGAVGVEVVFEPATTAPANESCASDPIDVSAGGSVSGSFVDVRDDLEVACGGEDGPELVYRFTLEEASDVLVGAATRDGSTLAVDLRPGCLRQSLRCARGAPVDLRQRNLPAGEYFLIVEAPLGNESDFTLDVSFEAPTEAPTNDTCADTGELLRTPATVMGTLRGLQDDLPSECGRFFRDAVYSLSVPERSDVVIRADGAGSALSLSLRGECEEASTQLGCATGDPVTLVVRDVEPGTYFIVLEAPLPVEYAMEVQRLPPTNAIAVSGNDTCETAQVLPAFAGTFSGTTAELSDDYGTFLCGSGAASPDAVFRLDLLRESRVIANTLGSDFDTVLHLHSRECTSRGERLCNDDSGDGATSAIDANLEAGVHFFVVDGWGGASSGRYFFQFSVE